MHFTALRRACPIEACTPHRLYHHTLHFLEGADIFRVFVYIALLSTGDNVSNMSKQNRKLHAISNHFTYVYRPFYYYHYSTPCETHVFR